MTADNKKRILDKICKCMRLAESCNPNEAAAALRQARALMKKHRLSQEQLFTSHVEEAVVATGAEAAPPFWSLALANLVGTAFDCRTFISRIPGAEPEFRFIGIEYAPTVCRYTFTVLYRHLKKARRKHLQTLIGQPEAEQVRRADVFAQAWLFRVARRVAEFTADPDNHAAIDAYVSAHYGETTDIHSDPIDPESRDYADILSGLRAADGISLYRPLYQSRQQDLLGQAVVAGT